MTPTSRTDKHAAWPPTTLGLPLQAAAVKRKRGTEPRFYAVSQGKNPGVYKTWEECLDQVKGHKGALFKAFTSALEAQAFVEGRQLVYSPTKSPTDQKFYAVQYGTVPGVYTDWPSAQAQIQGVRNPRYKKFSTRPEADAFVAVGKKLKPYQDISRFKDEEHIRQLMIQKSAPGLKIDGMYAPKNRDGKEFAPGKGPLPPGAMDGFDPNIKLNSDGLIVRKSEEEKFGTKMISKERGPPGMLKIYTDGSSLKNGQAGARAGVGVYFGPLDPKNVSEALKGTKQTNQRAELTAILRALDVAPRHRDVTIYTDSKYAISCVTEWYKSWVNNKWVNTKGKPVENKDLVVEIREKIEERDYLQRTTSFVWVKGHAGTEGNIAADRLAVNGATMGRGISPDLLGEETAMESLAEHCNT